MQQFCWIFERETLRERDLFDELLESLEATPGFEPSTYDLNRRQQWRPYDRQKASVDLTTQRTQFAMIRGDAKEVVAVFVLGKQGRQPRLMTRIDREVSIEKLIRVWSETLLEQGIDRGWISSRDWEAKLENKPQLDETDLKPVYLWDPESLPGNWSKIKRFSEKSGVCLTQRMGFWVLDIRAENQNLAGKTKQLGELSDLL